MRIYWGNRGPGIKTSNAVLTSGATAAVTIADLNHDGYPEMLLEIYRVCRKKVLWRKYLSRSLLYLLGFGRRLPVQRRTELPTTGARDVQVADLDGDGWPDIIYANRNGGASYIYWATSANGDYSPLRRTLLPTSHASRCAIADLNDDGRPDLVFSNENDERQNEVLSVIYWNSPTGFSSSQKTELPTLGAMGVTVKDLNNDGRPDIVFANARDGTAGQPVDTYLYWGNKKGKYSTLAREVLKAQGLMSYSAADLNADGYTDLVLVGKELRITWGSPLGFLKTNSFTLPVHYAFNARVADFNRDGYLDLSVSDWAGTDKDGVLIFWVDLRAFLRITDLL